MKRDKLMNEIKEAQRDPEFIREINRFIRAANKVHKL
jgi:hypothetical protein